ncbi:MAG TPA: CvpA family protein [Phycisphaerae bacterium]|nr:CvpA family protein [Phycisphaerae bacterium]
MWFSLFAVVLILTVTFFQGLQGLFSGVIMCVLTILSAALAFGLYEDIYWWQLVQHQPAHGRAIALMAVFILSLLILRTIFDLLIKNNMQFPSIADRVGGGLLGFITAMIIVGMLAIGIQMLPFGPSFLGFSRYALMDDTEKELEPTGSETDRRMFRANLEWDKIKRRRRAMWLSPDGFTAALVSSLSRNALHGRNSLSDFYPDPLRYLHNARSRYFPESRTVVGQDALTLEGFWNMPPGALYIRQLIKAESGGKKLFELKPDKQAPSPGMKRVIARVKISPDAQDEDGYHRFTTQQCRLVGRQGKDGPTEVSFVFGINHEQFDRWIRLYPGEGVTRKPEQGPLRVDLVFEVPDRPDYVPRFLEYKQNARVEIRPPDEKAAKEPVKPLAPDKPKEDKKKVQASPEQQEADQSDQPMRDRISGLGPARKDSAFKSELPFALTRYGGGADIANGEMRGGRIVATLDDDWQPPAGDQPAAELFQVPPEKRMLHLSVEKLQPQSWLGNIYGGIIDNIRDFYLIDESGEKYMPVGHYAMAVMSGKPTFELMYLDESQREFGRLPKFEKIKDRDLQGDYALFFLFHLPPGCKPTTLHTGRTDIDLRELNLVAPE